MVLDRAQVEDLTQALAEVEPSLKSARVDEEAALEELTAADQAVTEWQKAFEQHHRQSTESNREADRARAEIEVLDQRLMQASRRVEALEREGSTLDLAALHDAINELAAESASLSGREQEGQSQLDALREKLTGTQAALRAAEERYQAAQHDLHTREGRLESLRAMQQAALEDEAAESWLHDQGLESAPRLARALTVEEGWEAAVEAVLGHWLQSVVIGQAGGQAEQLAGLETATLALVEDRIGGVEARAGSLAARVKAPDAVMHWLNAVTTVESFEQAWAGRESLAEGESLITPDGEWIGRGWVRVARAQTEQDNMLAREKAISRLEGEVGEADWRRPRSLAAQIEKTRDQSGSLEQRVQAAAGRAECRAPQAQRGRRPARKPPVQRAPAGGATGAMTAESGELRQQARDDQAAVSKARGRLENLVDRMSGLKDERDALEAQRVELLARRDSGPQRTRRGPRPPPRAGTQGRVPARQPGLAAPDHWSAWIHSSSLLQQRYPQPQRENWPRPSRPTSCTAKKWTDYSSAAWRPRPGSAKRAPGCKAWRTTTAKKMRSGSGPFRPPTRSARTSSGPACSSRRSSSMHVACSGRSRSWGAMSMSLPANCRTMRQVGDWEADLDRLRENIVRLEPVNLAAIQEFEEEHKRKEYLDAQNADLCDALNTLENAIAKIDRKTRTRFKETFERVNKGVQELFPRLFGGGHAYLELTGEDLLTTGVSIMAQPPGKRVTSLHLLSGGEKALTAVAFVFSIFRLNPAPFCLLDEVDAPLDDANVVRFSTMVREMSDAVQFIVVTHNKITMEMAHQMSGVTMREPGVSRLVQVDIEEAAALAAS